MWGPPIPPPGQRAYGAIRRGGKEACCIQYADDTQLSLYSDSAVQCFTQCLDEIGGIAEKELAKPQPDKTEVMAMSWRKQQRRWCK